MKFPATATIEGASMSDQLSFEKDIRPLFTDMDVAHMKHAGMDLSNHDDVTKHADAIYQTVSIGSMPPPRSGEAVHTYCGISHLAGVAAEHGDHRRAALILGYVDATFARTGMKRAPTEERGYNRTMELLHRALPDTHVLKLCAEGASMDETLIVELAKATPQLAASA